MPATAVASASRYSLDLPKSDALPYFDNELDTQPQLCSRVDREIQAELAKIKKDPADLRLPPPTVEVFSSHPPLAAELERIGEQGQKTGALDIGRFQLPAPGGGLEASEEEWKKAIDNASTQLMYQEGRMLNIELLKRYGGEFVRSHTGHRNQAQI